MGNCSVALGCPGVVTQTEFCDEGSSLSATLVRKDVVITVPGVQGDIAGACRDLLGRVEWSRDVVGLTETVLLKGLEVFCASCMAGHSFCPPPPFRSTCWEV